MMIDFIEFMKTVPIQIVYIVLATVGGIARYLNSFANGNLHFKFSIFLASGFVAGFSGLMFALVGDSLAMPNPIPHIMAGVGGFFGEQTMKLVLEYVNKKSGGTPIK